MSELKPCQVCGSQACEGEWPEGGGTNRFGCSNFSGDCIACLMDATREEWNQRQEKQWRQVQEPASITLVETVDPESVAPEVLVRAREYSHYPQLDSGPGSTLKVMRGPGGGLYLSGVEDLREGDVFRREVRG